MHAPDLVRVEEVVVRVRDGVWVELGMGFELWLWLGPVLGLA